MSDIELVKSGEAAFSVQLKRSIVGVQLLVKVHPRIEEIFSRLLPDSPPERVAVFGRGWLPAAPGADLKFYQCPGGWADNPDSRYNMRLVGSEALYDDSGRVNLSWLRLVGASQGAGVEFNLRTVVSDKELGRVKTAIAQGMRDFYIDNIKPSSVRIELVVTELP